MSNTYECHGAKRGKLAACSRFSDELTRLTFIPKKKREFGESTTFSGSFLTRDLLIPLFSSPLCRIKSPFHELTRYVGDENCYTEFFGTGRHL